MASKGQKFNSYSPELRNEVVSKHINENRSFGSLAREYNISKGTIKGWLYRYKNGNNLSSDNRGRPNKDKDIDYKEKYEILKNYQAFLKAQREKK